jgi:hypothetical protein
MVARDQRMPGGRGDLEGYGPAGPWPSKRAPSDAGSAIQVHEHQRGWWTWKLERRALAKC